MKEKKAPPLFWTMKFMDQDAEQTLHKGTFLPGTIHIPRVGDFVRVAEMNQGDFLKVTDVYIDYSELEVTVCVEL